ncbi:MAG: hypothetical protein AAF721_05380 [Myxococcota bacterium]
MRSDVVDGGALVPELKLRRPDLEFQTRATGRDAADLTIERAGAGLQLELSVADGRTYTRNVPGDGGLGTRAVAADTVAFLDAVERGAIPAEPPDDKRRRRRGKPAQEKPLKDRLAEALHLGAGLGPSVTVPLAGNGGAAAGTFLAGNVALRAQTLRGAMFEFGVRVGGKRLSGHRLLRSRVAFGAGYRFTDGAFDMPITAAITVEPWSIRPRTSDATELEGDVPLLRPPAMIGLAVRAVPGALFPLRGGAVIRVGGGLELAGSGVQGAGAVRVVTENSNDLAFRVGGFETTFLAEVAIWVPWTTIRRKRR